MSTSPCYSWASTSATTGMAVSTVSQASVTRARLTPMEKNTCQRWDERRAGSRMSYSSTIRTRDMQQTQNNQSSRWKWQKEGMPWWGKLLRPYIRVTWGHMNRQQEWRWIKLPRLGLLWRQGPLRCVAMSRPTAGTRNQACIFFKEIISLQTFSQLEEKENTPVSIFARQKTHYALILKSGSLAVKKDWYLAVYCIMSSLVTIRQISRCMTDLLLSKKLIYSSAKRYHTVKSLYICFILYHTQFCW